MKICKHCEKEFNPKNPKGKFCSDKCRVYYSRKKPIALPNFHTVVAETPQEVVEYVKEVMDDQENEDIKRQIAAIKAEKIPEHRNKSSFGRKSWEIEQKNRIEELQKQLP
jgi:hypothetical protein